MSGNVTAPAMSEIRTPLTLSLSKGERAAGGV